jgi:glycosyltransferase involved in cell wall biosynthesis
LEQVFFQMALELTNHDISRIHFGYPSMRQGPSESLPKHFHQYVVIDTVNSDHRAGLEAQKYVQKHNIDTVFGFDQSVTAPAYKYLRRGGVKHFFSYWGAPVSSLSSPLKLLLKKIDVRIRGRHGPDHYIFESNGMARTATHGRGIPEHRVHIVYLGVDTHRFRPNEDDRNHIFRTFNISPDKKIFFFSGHMEPRKGVHIIMRAADLLVAKRPQIDWHIVLLGNREGDKERLLGELSNPITAEHITFGGYRSDIELLHRGCYAGIIASTGWDSLTMSSMEMQASGLPLLVSNLPGLNEAIEDKVTGFLFKPGEASELCELMQRLLDNINLRNQLAENARARINLSFTQRLQIQNLVNIVKQYA